jgi:hypothetical protein
MEEGARKRLGLSLHEPLPVEIKKMIDENAKKTASSAIQTGISTDAELEARKVTRAKALEDIPAKIKDVLSGIDAIVLSDDVLEVLKKRAKLLFEKRKALIDVGFSEEDAMKILLADLNSGFKPRGNQ